MSGRDAFLVTGGEVEGVRSAFKAAKARIDEHLRNERPVVLVMYISAHAAAGAVHLNGSLLTLKEVKSFLGSSGAKVRVLIVDACEAGTLISRKGGAAAPVYDVHLEPLELEGQVVISSAGPAESAEEWDALAGSLFTHHFLTALRGSAESGDDGSVTPEAYAMRTDRRSPSLRAAGSTRPSTDLRHWRVAHATGAAPRSSFRGLEGASCSCPLHLGRGGRGKGTGPSLRLAVPWSVLLRKRMGHQVGSGARPPLRR